MDTEIQTWREEGHVKTEAEIEVMLPQAKEHEEFWEPQENTRDKEGFFPRASRKSIAALKS